MKIEQIYWAITIIVIASATILWYLDIPTIGTFSIYKQISIPIIIFFIAFTGYKIFKEKS